MSGGSRRISDYDLVVYMDEEADAEHREEIEVMLSEEPSGAARMESWRKNDELLRMALGRVAAEPLPVSLTLNQKSAPSVESSAPASDAPIQAPIREVRRLERLRREQRERLVALTVGAFAAGALTMIAVADLTQIAPRALILPASYIFPNLKAEVSGERMARRAIEAFRTYADDESHPVEITAEDELTAWLTRRVGAPIRPPSLAGLGFHLLGGRLTPDEHGPAALLLYQSGSGNRVGLFVGRSSAEDKEFHYSEDRVTGSVWWTERGASYAILGRADRIGLMKVARAARVQEPTHSHFEIKSATRD
jgi:anti-sigma factor RsiW